MAYVSTRGLKGMSFEQAVLAGWADDGKSRRTNPLDSCLRADSLELLGGMVLPEAITVLSDDEFQAWRCAMQPLNQLDSAKRPSPTLITPVQSHDIP